MSRSATTRGLLWLGLLATLVLTVGASSAWGRAETTTVRFHGFRLSVPVSWPGFDLARDPSACVRFNRPALYLGTPSGTQRCPAPAVGRTEAILVQPLSAGASKAGATRGAAV